MGNQENYYKSIIDVLQDVVTDFVNDEYKNDNCKQACLLSIETEDIEHHKIIMTMTHMGRSFSHVLFPRKDSFYVYDILFVLIKDAYNQIM